MIPTHKDLNKQKWFKDSGNYWLYSDEEYSILIGHSFINRNQTIVMAIINMDTNLVTKKTFDKVLTKKEVITEWELLMDETLKKLFQ